MSAWHDLIGSLRQQPGLLTLSLASNRLPFKHALALVSLIGDADGLRDLQSLDLSGCTLSDQVGKRLGLVVAKHEHLTKVLLDNNQLHAATGRAFREAISAKHNALVHLSMRNNNLSAVAVQELAEPLASNSMLQVLRLDSNSLSGDLFPALERDEDRQPWGLFQLRILDLSCNRFSGYVPRALCEATSNFTHQHHFKVLPQAGDLLEFNPHFATLAAPPGLELREEKAMYVVDLSLLFSEEYLIEWLKEGEAHLISADGNAPKVLHPTTSCRMPNRAMTPGCMFVCTNHAKPCLYAEHCQTVQTILGSMFLWVGF